MAIKSRKAMASPRGPGVNTIPRLFQQRVREWGDRTAIREKDFGIWKDISWREYGQKAKYVALALHELGLEKDDRVAIISEDNPEWLYCDLGTQCAGGISVGIYTTDSPQQVEYVVGHSQARFYICEDEEQLDKILEVRQNLPELEKIIILDMEGLRHFEDPMTMNFDELIELGRKVDENDPTLFEKLLQIAQPEDTAFLV